MPLTPEAEQHRAAIRAEEKDERALMNILARRGWTWVLKKLVWSGLAIVKVDLNQEAAEQAKLLNNRITALIEEKSSETDSRSNP